MTKEEMKWVEERFDRIEAGLSKVEKLLTGNGTPERGVIVRLDRVEETIRRTRWYWRVVVVAIIGAIIDRFFRH